MMTARRVHGRAHSRRQEKPGQGSRGARVIPRKCASTGDRYGRRGAVILVVALVALALGPPHGGGVPCAGAAEPPRDTVGLSLAARAARFPPLRAAHATFNQEREVSLVDEVLRAGGTLTLETPDKMHLALTDPERLTIIAEGDRVTVLDANGTALPLPPEMAGVTQFAHALTDLLLGGRATGEFTEAWSGPDAVRLVPADAASPFAAIALRFPHAAPLPEEVVLTERNGDRTTIRLSDVHVTARDAGGNAPSPSGTRSSRPTPARTPR